MKPRARCRYFDNEGRGIRGGCHRSDCPFLHPSDPGWASAFQQQCKYYDERGAPIDGGCRQHQRGECIFTHPDDKNWAAAKSPLRRADTETWDSYVPNVPSRSKDPQPLRPSSHRRRVRCKFYDENGDPINGGCYGAAGKCPYVHPPDPEWAVADIPRLARPRDPTWPHPPGPPPIQRLGADPSNTQNQPASLWDAFDVSDKQPTSQKAFNKRPSINIPSSFSPATATQAGNDTKGNTPTDTAHNPWSGGWGGEKKDQTPNSGWGNNHSDASGWTTNSGWGDDATDNSGWGTEPQSNASNNNGWGEPSSSGWREGPSSTAWGSSWGDQPKDATEKNDGWGAPESSSTKVAATESKAKTKTKTLDEILDNWNTSSSALDKSPPKTNAASDGMLAKDDTPAPHVPPPRPRISIPLRQDSTPSASLDQPMTKSSVTTPADTRSMSAFGSSKTADTCWTDFVRYLRQAVVLQVQLNKVTIEYERCKRTQLSEIFGHTGLDARDHLDKWRTECREKKSHLTDKLAYATDMLMHTYEDHMASPTKTAIQLDEDFTRLFSDLRRADDDLTAIAQKDVINQEAAAKSGLLRTIPRLLDLFEEVKNNMESFLSYSYDEHMVEEFVEREYDAQLKAHAEEMNRTKNDADNMLQDIRALASQRMQLEDEVVDFEIQMKDWRQNKEGIDKKLQELQDAYELAQSQVAEREAELATEDAEVASLAAQVQAILLSPILCIEPRPPNSDEINTSIQLGMEALADDIKLVMDYIASQVKDTASRDQEAIVNEIVSVLRPAYRVIEAAHSWAQSQIVQA